MDAVETLWANIPAEVATAGLLPIVLLPLAGALVCGLFGRFVSRLVPAIAIAAMVGATGFALAAFVRLLALEPAQRYLVDRRFTLLAVERLHVDFALAFDPLAAVFVLVITGVGTLIHVFAAGYMRGDAGLPRFFAYLNLFVAAMLLLVLADSLLLCFFGWEGVGLASYLLIGFWTQNPANGGHAQKAFIANRIGDWGFVAAMLLLVAALGGHLPGSDRFAGGAKLVQARPAAGFPVEATPVEVEPTLDFRALAAIAAAEDAGGERVLGRALADLTWWGVPVVFLIGLGFFLGMSGKSAQIPLYLWLPDAMAGPTPVSALIHAATMVTAGVYLAARLSFLLALSPAIATLIAIVGVTTALLAGVLAVFQQDMKKVLAYSTISQLGFMFLAIGAGAPGAAVFHVVTHACFKACLFLAAGVVMHAVAERLPPADRSLSEARRRLQPDPADPQDLRNMGGLAAPLPRTHAAFLVGAIALAGLPVASGFFSKDEILWRAFSSPSLLVPGSLLYAVGLATAALTAFYVSRLYHLAFSGPVTRGHEAPAVMTGPVLALAAGSILVGPLLGWPEAWGGNATLEHFLAPALAAAGAPALPAATGSAVLVAQAASVAVALAGWLAGRALYRGRAHAALTALRARFDGLHRALWRRLYLDDLARALVVHPASDFARAADWLDRHLVDGVVAAVARGGRALASLGGFLDRFVVDALVGAVATGLAWGGRRLQRLQTGRLNQYTLGITLGAAVLVVIAWMVR